jgi:hypothetical protein
MTTNKRLKLIPAIARLDAPLKPPRPLPRRQRRLAAAWRRKTAPTSAQPAPIGRHSGMPKICPTCLDQWLQPGQHRCTDCGGATSAEHRRAARPVESLDPYGNYEGPEGSDLTSTLLNQIGSTRKESASHG